MASIVNDRSKRGYCIRLTERESPTGKRTKIACGTLRKRDAESIRQHLEEIVRSRQAGVTVSQATAEWLGRLDGNLRKRLEDLGLIQSAPKRIEAELAKYMRQYIERRTDLTDSTKRVYHRSLRFVERFFGEAKLTEVTVGMAKEFDRWLRNAGTQGCGVRLAENTARKMVNKLKTVFNSAVEDGLLTSNPFARIATNVTSNEERQRFVSNDTVLKLIAATSDDEFRAIIALSRFGGLRTPSEFRHLRPSDFQSRDGHPVLRITCQKTANSGKKSRECPLFPELKTYLQPLLDKASGNEFLFSAKYRDCSDANISYTMYRVLDKAGVEKWPDLWKNLRASRQTELLREYDIKDVCNWLGNSPAVAAKHYLRSNPDALRRATAGAEPPEAATASCPDGDLFGDLNTSEPPELRRTERNHAKTVRKRKACVSPLSKRKAAPSGAAFYGPCRTERESENAGKTLEICDSVNCGDLNGDLFAGLDGLIVRIVALPDKIRSSFVSHVETLLDSIECEGV